MHYDNGTMSKTDYETYTNLFEAMVMTPYFPHPDLLIYLEGSFDEIIERIHERGREMEKNTPISYWKELYNRYQDWINNFNACPILRINISDYDVMNQETSIEPILERIGILSNSHENGKRKNGYNYDSIKSLSQHPIMEVGTVEISI